MIDLGSSCFITDHLSSYVQSRSYRAPEVILGVPYGQKIDLWSLGCILAELATGYVLFQVSYEGSSSCIILLEAASVAHAQCKALLCFPSSCNFALRLSFFLPDFTISYPDSGTP